MKYTLLGFVFGLALYLGEAFSWYRIQEMFWFESFHMYGIIITAVVIGFIGLRIMKVFNVKASTGEVFVLKKKAVQPKAQLIGGIIFGMGWALTGFCVGPIFVILGYGNLFVLVIFIGVLLGGISYGYLKPRLPH